MPASHAAPSRHWSRNPSRAIRNVFVATFSCAVLLTLALYATAPTHYAFAVTVQTSSPQAIESSVVAFYGQVTDESGAGIAGVVVSVSVPADQDTHRSHRGRFGPPTPWGPLSWYADGASYAGAALTATTDATGRYSIDAPPGRYNLTFSYVRDHHLYTKSMTLNGIGGHAYNVSATLTAHSAFIFVPISGY